MDSPHKKKLRILWNWEVKFKQAVTTDDAGQDGSARYWKTPRKEKTAHKKFQDKENTGHFIMFSMITNIYNEKTKGPTLMELFTATGKLKKFFFTTRDVQCVHHGWHGTHRRDIQVLATRACVARTWISYTRTWCTHRTSLVVKKNFFSFPVAVNNSIKVGPLVFSL